MKIDASLRVTFERRRESDGAPFYVYAQSVSRNTAREFWQVVQRATNQLYINSGSPQGALRFAAAAVREAGTFLGNERVEQFFIGEMRRLAMVVLPGGESLTFDEAVKNGALSEDEVDEMEAALCFFTLAWNFHSTENRALIIASALTLWNGRTTSSSFTEWTASLPISKETVNSGAKTEAAPEKAATGSSAPS